MLTIPCRLPYEGLCWFLSFFQPTLVQHASAILQYRPNTDLLWTVLGMFFFYGGRRMVKLRFHLHAIP